MIEKQKKQKCRHRKRWKIKDGRKVKRDESCRSVQRERKICLIRCAEMSRRTD